MTDYFSSWSRWMNAGFSVANTNLRALGTLHASGEVVMARSAIIASAIRAPATADHMEIAAIVPEKVTAFGLAASASLASFTVMQSAMLAEMQRYARIGGARRTPTMAEAAELWSRSGEFVLGAVESAAQGGKATLAPVHKAVAANARRLKRRSRAAL